MDNSDNKNGNLGKQEWTIDIARMDNWESKNGQLDYIDDYYILQLNQIKIYKIIQTILYEFLKP